ncbi:MAG: acetylxylan esterase [Peptoniphilaceae bacterium]|nr:acetylxylan esterase [Peptoniphilaceae bacterium]
MIKKHFNSVDEMSYTKLENHKPADFEDFWAGQIKDLEGLTPSYKIERAFEDDFERGDFYHLYFESFDQSMIHCKYLRPKTEEKFPLVVTFHGYPGATRSYFEYSSFLDQGIAVLAMDCRGQGGLSFEMEKARLNKGPTVSGHIIDGINGDKEDLFYINIFKDAYLTVNLAKSLEGVDVDKIYLAGSSQGGGITIVTGALQREVVKKAYILYPFLTDYRKVYELDYDELAYEGLRYYMRWFDPQGKDLDKFFDKLAYIDAANFADKIEADIIYGISLADEVIPPEVQLAVYNEIKAPKKLFQFKGFGHEKICPMEDEVLPFFKDDQTLNDNIARREDSFTYKYINEGNDSLLFYLNPTINMGCHYLRRFSELNMDSLSYDFTNSEENLANIEALWDKYKDKYENIYIIGQREATDIALDLGCDKKLRGLILQGMLFDEKSIDKAKKIKAPVFMASAGLDDLENKDLTKKVAESFNKAKILYYPKYEYERINDFEDEKMVFLNKIKKRG